MSEEPNDLRKIAGALLGATVLLTLLLSAFAGAATQTAPRDVPLAVVGPEPAVAQVSDRLDDQSPGAFEVTGAADETEAEELIADREVYAALVLGPQGPSQMTIATAASPAVANVLTGVADGLGVEVRDAAPPPADDPRMAGLGGGVLPITIGGVIAGTIAALLVVGIGRKVAVLGAGAVLFSTVTVSILHGVYGSLEGSVALELLAVAAGVFAIGSILSGLHATAGRVGLVLGDLVLILVGNPFSGAQSAPELIAEPWSTVGHTLPLGATVDLLRGISGFDAAGTGAAWLTLGVWIALGLLLTIGPALVRQSVDEPAELSAHAA